MASKFSRSVDGVIGWVNARAPGLMPAYKKHMTGVLRAEELQHLVLLRLAGHAGAGQPDRHRHLPDDALQAVSAAEAFASVEYIMRDVEWGWLIRYMHSTGASLFFVVVYLHMFRGLIYGSYQKPRELVWVLGMVIFLVLMAEAFMGYVLPWGQMSYWGAQVIINLFGTIPFIGDELTEWIRGDYLVADATLNRFFALHVIALPLVLLLLVVLHLGALHEVGSNNPDGVDIKKGQGPRPPGKPKDGIAFHPVLHGQGPVRRRFLPDPRSPSSSSSRRPWAAGSWSGTTSSRPTRWSPRRTSSRCGTSPRSTRCCAPSRIRCSA